MAAITVGHLICTSALVTLTFVMPFFYGYVVDDIRANMIERELKEIADYVSNTFASLFFLVNSTSFSSVSAQKEMMHIPSSVENSIYVVEIQGVSGNASEIVAYLRDQPSILAESWLVPGLKVGDDNSVEGGGRMIVGCSRVGQDIFAWIQRW